MGGSSGGTLTVAHLDSGRTWRGGQQQVFLLMRGLARLGCRQVLVAPDGPLGERVRALGIETRSLRARGDLDLPAAFAFANLAKEFGPDVVHAHDARSHGVGWLGARLAGGSAFVVSRRTAFAAATHPASRLKYMLPVDRYLAVSASVRDALRAAHVPDPRIRVIPSGIEIDGPPDAESLRRAFGLAEDARLIGIVASLTREKGQDVAIDALARLPSTSGEVHLALIGEGQERDVLTARADRCGVASHVHWTGFRSDARALLRQLDLCLVPSFVEGLGTTALEAQAEGVAVIASRAGGLPEVVRDGETGRLVPPGDADALARAIGEAFANPGTTRQWVDRAREEVRRHDVDRTVRDTLAVYHEVAREPRLDAPARRG